MQLSKRGCAGVLYRRANCTLALPTVYTDCTKSLINSIAFELPRLFCISGALGSPAPSSPSSGGQGAAEGSPGLGFGGARASASYYTRCDRLFVDSTYEDADCMASRLSLSMNNSCNSVDCDSHLCVISLYCSFILQKYIRLTVLHRFYVIITHSHSICISHLQLCTHMIVL